jgi:hypothetical protein
VLVVPTDEERMIARETLRALSRDYLVQASDACQREPILIEVSAHHIHLAQQTSRRSFGPGHQLTKHADLSQPGQYRVQGAARPLSVRKAASSAYACSARAQGHAGRDRDDRAVQAQAFIRRSANRATSKARPVARSKVRLAASPSTKARSCALRHIHMTLQMPCATA